MKHTAFLIAASLVLASCAHRTDDGIDPAASPGDSPVEMLDGEAAYTEHCAGCHETGMLGAPREGEPQDWQGRSNLWQGVLMEHARTGYFDMPARGGQAQLPDDLVDAAAEYMLEQTFQDRPKD